MREDPNPEKPLHEKMFAGDNFVRKSGDYLAWQELQLHALQAYDKGADLNVMVSVWTTRRMRDHALRLLHGNVSIARQACSLGSSRLCKESSCPGQALCSISVQHDCIFAAWQGLYMCLPWLCGHP